MCQPRVSSPSGVVGRARAWRGFTLLELMIVLVILGLATSAVLLAWRDVGQSRLDVQAQRWSDQLEARRMHARLSGVAERWDVRAEQVRNPQWGLEVASGGVILGPEPVMEPVQIRVWLLEEPQRSLWIVSDGRRAFQVQSSEPLP